MSSEVQRFNDVIKEDGDIREGTGGKFAAKHNLPLSMSIQMGGGESTITTQITIPKAEIPPLIDELKEIFTKESEQFSDVENIKSITFNLTTQGEIVPNSLKVDTLRPSKQTTQPSKKAQTEKKAHAEMGLCENCKVNQGPHHSFTYGKTLAQSTSSSGSGAVTKTTVTTNFEIAGQMSAPICDKCREEYHRKSLLSGLVAAAVASVPLAIFVILLIATNGEAEGFANALLFLTLPIFSGPIALIGWVRLFNVLEDGAQRAGENLAIELHQDELNKQGFDKTWNSRRYDQLKRFGK